MAAVATCSARATATGPLECISLEDPGEPGAWVSMAARKARPWRRDRGRTGRNDRGPVRRRRARHRGPQPAWSRRRDRPRRRVPVPAPFTTPSPGCRRVQVRQRGRGAALRARRYFGGASSAIALRTVSSRTQLPYDRSHRHLLGPVQLAEVRPVFHAGHPSSRPGSTSQPPGEGQLSSVVTGPHFSRRRQPGPRPVAVVPPSHGRCGGTAAPTRPAEAAAKRVLPLPGSGAAT